MGWGVVDATLTSVSDACCVLSQHWQVEGDVARDPLCGHQPPGEGVADALQVDGTAAWGVLQTGQTAGAAVIQPGYSVVVTLFRKNDNAILKSSSLFSAGSYIEE